MLKKSTAAFLVVIASAMVSGTSAEAQWSRGPRVFAGPGGPVTLTPGYGYPAATATPANAPPTVVPYSYYVLPNTVPSRTYNGPAEFPFYGRPYGHVYDRWSWPYMTKDNAVLDRYFYPPLG